MSLISSCPQCAKQVSIPLGVDPQTKVRCPLCQSEFALHAALDLAPPMLELVESPADLGIDVGDVAAEEFTHAPAALAAAGGSFTEGLTEHSLADTEPMFSEDISFDAPPAGEGDGEGGEEFDTELEGLKSPADAGDLPDDSMFEDAGELDLSEAPGDDSPFGLGGPMSSTEEAPLGELDESPASGLPPSVSAAKRRKKEPSALGTLIGVVGGGLVAVPLSLFAVCWIGGPDKDFAGLSQYLPKWMLPPSFSKVKTAAVVPPPLMPMSGQPTPKDLDEVKKAADDAGFGNMKLNVPALPDKPATDDVADDSTPDDVGDEASPDKSTASDDAPSDKTADDDAFASSEDKPDKASFDEPGDEMPADSTEEPAATDTAATDDLLADEMAADDTADEVPTKPTKSAKVGLVEPVTYSLADLTAVTGEVQELLAQLNDPSLDKDALKKLKMPFYRKCSRLGEVVTFAADDTDETGVADQQTAIESILSEIGADKAKFAEISAVGGKWLSLPAEKRGDDKGVLLAGTVDDVSKAGAMHRVQLTVAGRNEPVSIYSAAKPELAVGDSAVILGSIVANPQESLHNFTGDEATVVWQGLAVKTAAK